MYSYNDKKIAELVKQMKLSIRQMKRDLNMTADITIRKWIDGEDLSISRIIQLCNTYKINITDFFLIDGEILTTQQKLNEIESVPVSDNSAAFMIQKEREISDLRIKNKEELFALKEEMYALRESHIKELVEITLKLKEEERENLNKQRIQDWENFEERIKEKDKDIVLLRKAMSEMQMQYKELELSTSHTTTRSKTLNIANEPGSTYKKK